MVVMRTTSPLPTLGCRRIGSCVGAPLNGRGSTRTSSGLPQFSGGHSSEGSAGRRRWSGEVDLGRSAGLPFRFPARYRRLARIGGFLGRRFPVRDRPGSSRAPAALPTVGLRRRSGCPAREVIRRVGVSGRLRPLAKETRPGRVWRRQSTGIGGPGVQRRAALIAVGRSHRWWPRHRQCWFAPPGVVGRRATRRFRGTSDGSSRSTGARLSVLAVHLSMDGVRLAGGGRWCRIGQVSGPGTYPARQFMNRRGAAWVVVGRGLASDGLRCFLTS
jgi:hypothetical protein